MTPLLPLAFLSLIAGSLAVVGIGNCVDTKDGCLDCAKTYSIGGHHVARPLGCYLSRGNAKGNALPYGSLVNHNKGDHRIMTNIWEETGDAQQIIGAYCGMHALDAGHKYIGIEYNGECYFGSEADIDVTGQGLVPAGECAKRCKFDVGHAHTMFIYHVEERKNK